MIEISRQVARRVRAVFGRALGKTPKGRPGPWVTFAATPDSITLRAANHEAAVQYHQLTRQATHTVAVPLELLTHCGGRKPDPVHVRALDDGTGELHWSEAGIPRRESFRCPDKDASEFPALPPTLVQNPPGLLSALRHACDVTDQEALRYALNCVQLRGSGGRVTGTDGRHLYVQEGFTFPWTDDLLVARNAVIGCPELPTDLPVGMGHTEQHLVLQIGPWTIWLPIVREGRFPQIDRQLRTAVTAVGRLVLGDTDSRFMLDRLNHLPGNTCENRPVTLDLNGQVILRAKGDDAQTTELQLAGSSFSGTPVKLATNRKYLLHALQMGFREVCLFNKQTPAMCHDDRRHYIWVPLSQEYLLPAELTESPEETFVQTEHEAPPAEAVAAMSLDREQYHLPSTTDQPIPRQPSPEQPISATDAVAPSTIALSSQPPMGIQSADGVTELLSPLEQALAVKASLREALQNTDSLIRALRQSRRAVRSSRDSSANRRPAKVAG